MSEGSRQSTAPPRVQVDLLYLDLTTCNRCIGTASSLDRAVELLSPILREVGVQLDVRKKLVESEDEARELGLVSSPTILVDGYDIAGELRESRCGPCGDACGCGNGDTCIDCRVWIYNGNEQTQAPVGLIADAILGSVYGRPRGRHSPRAAKLNENLKRFFAGKRRREATRDRAAVSSCC